MRLYIIRHADPDYKNNTITPQGHLEAQALAQHLAKFNLDEIYSSPMGRAIHTAEYTAKLTGKTINIEHWTEELGYRVEQEPWGDLHICDVPGEVIRECAGRYNNDLWYNEKPFNSDVCLPMLERLRTSSDEFLRRMGYEREGGRYRCVVQNRKRVAVFCHAGLGMLWFSHLLGIPAPMVWAGFWPAPSSITTIRFEERSDTWAVPRCLGFGEIAHLHIAGLTAQPSGLYGVD